MKPVFHHNTTKLCLVAFKKVGSRFLNSSSSVIGDFDVEFMTQEVLWCGNYWSDGGVVYLMMANDVSHRRREIIML